MDFLQDRRIQIVVGGGVALLLALLVAVFALRQPPRAGEADMAAKAGLQVNTVRDEAKVSQTKPLRCFVGGQYVGDFPVLECAKRNGVAAQALDVGLDAAAPPPPPPGATPSAAAPVAPGAAPSEPAPAQPAQGSTVTAGEAQVAVATPGDCLRFVGGEWRAAGRGMSVSQCVRILYDGRCVRPGDALYGRSGTQTVRLVAGKVEISPDNRVFRPLMAQDPGDCSLPAG
jgi:hypothetical protein